MLTVIINMENWKITIPVHLYGEEIEGKWVNMPKWDYFNLECTATTEEIISNNFWAKLEKERRVALGMAHWLCEGGNLGQYINPKIYEAMEACYPSFSGILALSPHDIVPF
jgi:hypothetical protein